MGLTIRRGDIFYIRSNYAEIGCEQRGDRPGVVVSNNKANQFSPVVSIVYLTTRHKTKLPTHVRVQCERPSIALCEHVYSISVDRLDRRVGHVTKYEQERIDEALRVSLMLKKEERKVKDLTVIDMNGIYTIDSREVATMVDRPHNDLMKSIRQYCEHLTAGDFSLSDFFIPSTYKDRTGRELLCYLITRKGCDMVANKMTGEKGVLFTAAYINKFHEMERSEQASIPKTYPEALRLAADLAEQNNVLQLEIGELKPKAAYADEILLSDGTMTATQIAADYGMSAIKLNRILHDARIQRKVGEQWVLYAEHLGKGYTDSETFEYDHRDGAKASKPLTKWTQKGRLMINEVLNKRGIYANSQEEKGA